MKVSGRAWNALTLGEKLAILYEAARKNKQRWVGE